MMDVGLLTARAAGGDLESFGQLYDSCFNRVYDFTWRVLRDADAAAEVTQAVFERAAGSLREIGNSGDFEAWVLLAAADESLARVEAAGRAPAPFHEEAFGSFDVPDPCRVRDAQLVGGDHALACTIWEAATGLGARDYAALDLHLRQGIEPAAVAPILGVGRGSAAVVLRRLESAADEAMLTYVLARRGAAGCERLRGVLLEYGFPPFDKDVRDAIDAHVATCAVCKRMRALPSEPTAVLQSFAPVQAPFALKGDTWRAVAAGWGGRGQALEAAGASATAGAAAYRRESTPAYAGGALAAETAYGGGGGFDLPRTDAPYSDDGDSRNVVWFLAAAAGILAVAFIIGGIAVGAFGFGRNGGSGGATGGTRTVTAVSSPATTTSTASVRVDTPTPAPATATVPPATETPVPPSATAEPPTATAVPATPTRTGPPATATKPAPTPTKPAPAPTATRTVRP